MKTPLRLILTFGVLAAAAFAQDTEYNQIALRVMKEPAVPVNDLPAALGDPAESARLHDKGGHPLHQGRQPKTRGCGGGSRDELPAGEIN